MGCLSAICLVLGSYSENTHPYFSESTHHPAEKRVLEQLEMPEMVFAGSQEVQKRVKLGRGKWQKTVKKCWLT